MQKIDLRGVKSTGILKEEGVYVGVISDVSERYQKGTNALQTVISCQDNNTGLINNVILTWKDDLMGRNKGELMILGLDLDNEEFEPTRLIGTPIRFECKYAVERNARDSLGQPIQGKKSDYLGCTILGLDESNQTVAPAQVASTNVAPMPQVQPQAPIQQGVATPPAVDTMTYAQPQQQQPQVQPMSPAPAPTPQVVEQQAQPMTQPQNYVYQDGSIAPQPIAQPQAQQPVQTPQPQVVAQQPMAQTQAVQAPISNIPGLNV